MNKEYIKSLAFEYLDSKLNQPKGQSKKFYEVGNKQMIALVTTYVEGYIQALEV